MNLASWLDHALLYVAVINLGVALVASALITYASLVIRRLADVPVQDRNRWPSVSLIAPARNEARNIERAVRSLMKLDYPDLEITIVNDRSTDATGTILDCLAAEFPQLNVVQVNELPAGWLGKNHALKLGAERSRGAWLLFTDADVVFEPTALKRAMNYAETNGVDHLAATPDCRMPSWLLSAFVVTFSIYFSLYVRIWAVRNPRRRAHIGVGAFNLVRAAVYRAVGGHQSIRLRPDDDLKLGKIIKLAGYRQDVVSGAGMIAVEWYASLSEVVRGLEKNAFSGADYRVWLTVLSSTLSLVFNVWPYAAVFLVPASARWVYLAVCLTLWGMAWRAARDLRVAPSTALGFPLAVLLLVYIQWRTMLLNYWLGGIRWRDTHYSLAELKANKV
jgi:cellulose synthase/poly-beta-1,6-N-acetylglucosamine synthase-like glycosyltransferase